MSPVSVLDVSGQHHSSQGGQTSAAISMALSEVGAEDEEETAEDRINRIMEARKLLPNASYFAFTATPKNKTLEIFGEPFEEDGTTKHRPFHTYTMKQAIEEGFILDVLKFYTPVNSYYKLVKTTEDDPEFDTKRAKKKLRRYVESHDHAIALKAEIMVDHFHEQVIGLRKIGGHARAMVVTSGIARAIQYFHAFREYLKERKSAYQAIVAFSGEHEYGGMRVTEASLNGFPSNQIAEKIREDPYRFLICADKFQTGYDEPLLHTMYVDKTLSSIKAVQTLSRLNRAHPQKHDVFVLDFLNDADTISAAFEDYYRTTILSEETDPNKLHDLKAALDADQVYSPEQVDALVDLYLGGADRDRLDPILDNCVATYREQLDEDGQVDFKGKAKAFTRTYGFLSSILPYTSAEWEKLSIFLNFLIPKLPAPKEQDLSKDILETIDMDSYRVEKQAAIRIQLPDADAEIGPVPASGGGRMAEPELDRLSNILKTFNDQFGNINWKDEDKILKVITEEIPAKVATDAAYQNAMKQSDKQNARIEHDAALQRVMNDLLSDHTELFRQFVDNPQFRKWLQDEVFRSTYRTLISSTSMADLVPFERTTNPNDYYRTAVPLMTLEAAASAFGMVDPADVREWVAPRTSRKLSEGMFVARVVGSSMEPQIPDGAYCLFGPATGGSRAGRILLVQHRDISDPETGGSYTVKRYESDKVTDADGTWSHTQVRLQPANRAFVPIILTLEAEDEIRPVAEFVEVLR